MAEFKAQILGILIVVVIFGALLGIYKSMAEGTLNDVSKKVSEVVNSSYK